MSKIMIWVGQFDSEADFEKYMDQSAFRKWWKEYDEDNKEMRCQFCKELGVMDYDEDFLIMKYAPAGLLELLNFIPADTQKINQAVVGNGIEKANVAIMYNCREGISTQKAANAVSVSFLGTFDFDLNPTGTTASTAGLKYMTWIGHTDKSETEFMEYFNQDEYMKEIRDYEEGRTKKRPNPEHRCQFCKDVNIKYYYPEFLTVEIKDEPENPFNLVRMMIDNKLVLDWYIESDIDEYHIKPSNCIVCYIPNGFKDNKRNQKIFIKKKNYDSYETPKKFVDELDSYNGIQYLETYIAE